jgi:predicted ribosome quality control (RQC) complex YloA/Tae2 family protein
MELFYFTLKRQTEYLQQYLPGSRIIECYTQQKNELTIRLNKRDTSSLILLLSSDARYPFMLLRQPGKRATISTNVLAQLINKEIAELLLSPADRIVSLSFHNWDHRLILQFFRNNTNFLIIDSSDKIVSSFKRERKIKDQHYRIQPSSLLHPMEINFQQFHMQCQENLVLSVYEFLKDNFLFMTGVLIREIIARAALSDRITLKALQDRELKSLYRLMKKFLSDCQTDPVRIYMKNEFPQAFALTEMLIYQSLSAMYYEDINDALSFFIFTRRKMDRIGQKRSVIENLLNKKLNQLENLLAHLQNLPDEQEQRSYYQKIGELILAQMHSFPEKESQINLVDLYDPSQQILQVSVNPKISLRENAQVFFNKSREVSNRAKQVKESIRIHEKQLKQLRHFQAILDHDLSMKDLQKIEKKLIEMKVMQTDDERLQETFRPYRQYIYHNWEIWVGKNARSNDEMTFHIAHKEDLWLHAQGVGGSHVIIRRANRRSDIPRQVLERAARLAAGNSRARTSSYVPVMYTQVKYVRKPKGSEPGSVSAERTKTLFVEPERV